MAPSPRPEWERFWEKVDASGVCWEWSAYIRPDGYGQFHELPNHRAIVAHRKSWKMLVGPIPEGLVLDHLCKNPKCVNPDHLEPVTQGTNVRRGGSGVAQSQRTHCPRDHEYTEENTRIYAGKRFCRACDRLRRKAEVK